ncbi:hypothetical protein [Xanthocytophaga agilis]|uniref:Uncharacterized protein n=1 Tax=Xanthocytophaga agilis TaxID=3048010 RepID=A0AAE3UII1_9BACT|nr:hypothetical protein [Xanthocytophaga agilis]MDJ1505411.1 hypothetical protein [Xanthocytophaga agilis]
MRRVAQVQNHSRIKRVMVYRDEDGFYLFFYDKAEDCSSFEDRYYSTIEDIYDFCEQQYNIKEKGWQDIADPEPDCQHDWITPVRIKDRIIGKPQWGRYEKLVNGVWVDIKEMDS